MFTVCLKKMNKITRNSFVSDFEIGPVQEFSFMLIVIILWKFIINRHYKKILILMFKNYRYEEIYSMNKLKILRTLYL